MLSLRSLICLLLPLASALQSSALRTDGKSTLRLPLTPIKSPRQRGLNARGLTVDLKNGGTAYLASITVGTQPMQVYIDTGSTLLVIRREDYDPAKSSDSKDLGSTEEYFYADGSGGHVHLWTDDVEIGGLTVKGVAVGRLEESGEESQLEYGILGLGDWDAAHVDSSEPPLFTSMQEQGLVSGDDFTLDLVEGGGGSSLIFNDPDASSFTYHETDNGLIQASTSGLQSPAVIDSGTTSIVLTQADFFSFAKAHEFEPIQDDTDPIGAYLIIGDCNQDPGVSFTFDDQTIAIPSSIFWSGGKADNGQCVASIVGLPDEHLKDVWLLGDAFFHAVKVNFSKGRLGFLARE